MATAATGMRAYVIVWAGQLVSLIGSTMTAFGMDVWVFQKSGSVALLGLMLALGVLPFALVSPFTGSLVDRWGAKRSLVVSNGGYLFLTLLMALLLLTNSFQLWHVFVVGVALTLVSALAMPRIRGAGADSGPEGAARRANALRMLAVAVSQSLAPAAGGFVFLASGLGESSWPTSPRSSWPRSPSSSFASPLPTWSRRRQPVRGRCWRISAWPGA